MANHKLTLSVLEGNYAICKLSPEDPVPARVERSAFWSVTRTREELSIVCGEREVPDAAKCDKGWRCMKVHGPLDFSLTGVLASLAGPLAEAGISLFTISTYDTDDLFVKEERLEQARLLLTQCGHEVL